MPEKIEQRSVSVRIDGKEVESSIRNIAKEAAGLRSEMNQLVEVNEEYVSRAIRLAELKEATEKHRDEIKRIGEAWGRMPEDVKAAVSKAQGDIAYLTEAITKLRMLDPTSELANKLEGDIKTIKQGIQTTVNEYIKLGEAGENSLEKIENEYKQLYAEIRKTDAKTEEYYRKVKKLGELDKQIQEHRNDIKHVEQAWYKNIPAIQGFAAAAVGALAIDQVLAYGRALMQNAVIMDTNLRKASSVLADNLGRINAEAERHAGSFGIARSQYVGAAADMSAFFQSQFASRTEAAKLSNEAVKLAGVLAGFKGGGAEAFAEALEAIKGGFSDNVEELAKFNIALSDDIIKAAMAEKGLDKLNAKQQEHGKGLVLLQLIQEKATAQTKAFGDMQVGLAAQTAKMDAKLKEIGDTLSRVLIPIFNRMLDIVAPVVSSIGAVTDGIERLSQPVKTASEAFYRQKGEVENLTQSLTPLTDRYKNLSEKSKLSKKEQGELKDVIKKIGEIVPTAVTEFDKYGVALSINTDRVGKYMKAQKQLMEFLNHDAIEKQENELKALQFQQKLAEDTIDKVEKGLIKRKKYVLLPEDSPFNEKRELNEKEAGAYIKNLQDLTAKVEGAELNLKRLRGQPLVETTTPEVKPDLSGTSEDERKNADNHRNEVIRNLEKLAEAIKTHRSDLREQEMRDDERDTERVREKYRKDIELAEELIQEGGQVAQRASAWRKELVSMEYAEINAKKKENAEKLIEDLKALSSRYAIAEGDIALNQLAQKLQTIKNKFAGEFAKIANAERSSDPSVKAQAAQTRADIEKAMNADIEAERDRHFVALYKKQEANWQETELATMDERDRETWKIIFHYQDLIDANIRNHKEVKRLLEAQNREIAAVKDKHRKEDFEKTVDNQRKLLQTQKSVNEQDRRIQQAKMDSMRQGVELFGALLGDNAKKSVAYLVISKGIAIAEILINARREASAIRLAAALQAAAASTNPITIGLAPIIKIKGEVEAGLAILRGALGAGVIAAQGVAEYRANQKAEGGYTTVIGEQDGKSYRAQYKGKATTGPVLNPSVFLAGEQPEYVIAYPETQNPIVANFLPILEGLRQRRVRGYNDGGEVTTNTTARFSSRPPQTPFPKPQTTEGGVFVSHELMTRWIESVDMARAAFEAGIKLTYEGADRIEKMMAQNVETRGYSR